LLKLKLLIKKWSFNRRNIRFLRLIRFINNYLIESRPHLYLILCAKEFWYKNASDKLPLNLFLK
jgi:hypothetical protein